MHYLSCIIHTIHNPMISTASVFTSIASSNVTFFGLAMAPIGIYRGGSAFCRKEKSKIVKMSCGATAAVSLSFYQNFVQFQVVNNIVTESLFTNVVTDPIVTYGCIGAASYCIGHILGYAVERNNKKSEDRFVALNQGITLDHTYQGKKE